MGLKEKNLNRVRVGFGFYYKTRNPARNSVIYIITKIPSYIYIVINPNISHSSFHFSIQLPRLSSLQLTPPPLISLLTISLTPNLTAGPTALPLSAALALIAVPSCFSSLTHCLTRPLLPLHLSVLSLTWPQAHKQSRTGTAPFRPRRR